MNNGIQKYIVGGVDDAVRSAAHIVERPRQEIRPWVDDLAYQLGPGNRYRADRREGPGKETARRTIAVSIQYLLISRSGDQTAIDLDGNRRSTR